LLGLSLINVFDITLMLLNMVRILIYYIYKRIEIKLL